MFLLAIYFSREINFLFTDIRRDNGSAPPRIETDDLWPRKWRSLSLIVTVNIIDPEDMVQGSGTRCWLARDSSYGNPRSNRDTRSSSLFLYIISAVPGKPKIRTRRSLANIDTTRSRREPGKLENCSRRSLDLELLHTEFRDYLQLFRSYIFLRRTWLRVRAKWLTNKTGSWPLKAIFDQQKGMQDYAR